MTRLGLVTFLAVALSACVADKLPTFGGQSGDDPAVDETTEELSCDETPTDVYERYVEPIVAGEAPSTCNQCHFSGIDLSLFVRDTPCESMACMAKQGFVDFDNPQASQVLSWITLAQPQSQLITQEVIDREYQGFLDWITWSAECHESECGYIEDPCGTGTGEDPPGGTAHLGGCDETALATSFAQKVLKWKGRCLACHQYNAPENVEGTAGEWMDPSEGPNAVKFTMYNMIAYEVIDLTNPGASLFITKPLAEAEGGVTHDGGPKIANKTEETYTDFLAWAQQYASCFGSTP